MIANSVARRLFQLRGSLGLSTDAMAKAVGLKERKSWEGYESGKRLPNGTVLERLARMGFDANWLLIGEGEIRLQPATYVQRLNRESQQLGRRLAADPESGHQPRTDTAEIDEELLTEVIDEVETWLGERQRALPPEKKAALISIIYGEMIKTKASGEGAILATVERLGRLVS